MDSPEVPEHAVSTIYCDFCKHAMHRASWPVKLYADDLCNTPLFDQLEVFFDSARAAMRSHFPAVGPRCRGAEWMQATKPRWILHNDNGMEPINFHEDQYGNFKGEERLD